MLHNSEKLLSIDNIIFVYNISIMLHTIEKMLYTIDNIIFVYNILIMLYNSKKVVD